MSASAPGKVLWAGEYAVLDGAPAVITAVNRRVRACAPSARAGELSPFLAAAAAEVAAHFGPESLPAAAARRAWVDSAALEQRGRKLGLGSSAAATVAAIAAALCHAGSPAPRSPGPTGHRSPVTGSGSGSGPPPSPSPPPSPGREGHLGGSITPPVTGDRWSRGAGEPERTGGGDGEGGGGGPEADQIALIHRLAHRAHAAAQAPRGSRGSGADIAASVHGGLLCVTRTGDEPLAVERLPYPTELAFVLVWTETPADTPSLVARVRALRERDSRGHAAAIASLGEASAALADAFRRAHIADILSSITGANSALAELAARSGAPLVPPSFSPVAALATSFGGAAKPTGAGGGDLILVVFPSASSSAAFRGAAHHEGMICIPAAVDPCGVRLADEAESA